MQLWSCKAKTKSQIQFLRKICTQQPYLWRLWQSEYLGNTDICKLSSSCHITLSLIACSLAENNDLFNEEGNESQEEVSTLYGYHVVWCTEICDFILQVVADILSKVLDERNTPAFEDTAQVTNAVW